MNEKNETTAKKKNIKITEKQISTWSIEHSLGVSCQFVSNYLYNIGIEKEKEHTYTQAKHDEESVFISEILWI